MTEIMYTAVPSFALANSRKDRGDGNNDLHVYSSSHISKGLYVHSFIRSCEAGSLGLRSIAEENTEEEGHLFKVIQMTIKHGTRFLNSCFCNFFLSAKAWPRDIVGENKRLGCQFLWNLQEILTVLSGARGELFALSTVFDFI